MSLLTIILVAALVGLCYWLGFKKPRKFPPGPATVPFLGSLPFIPHVSGFLAHCATLMISKYGKVVGMYLGRFPIVAIYDFNIAKELFAKNELTGRPDNFLYRYRMLGKKQGLLFNDGASWKSHRRFSLKTLRDFGFGKHSMENILQEEANRMVEFLSEKADQPIYVQTLFNLAILNILWVIVANKRYELSDPRAQNAMKVLTESVQLENLRFLYNMPWSRFFFPSASGWNKQKESIHSIHQMVGEMLKEHQDTFEEDHLRDFIDVYLKNIQNGEHPDFNYDQLLVTAMDLFSAGSETTSTTLAWAVLFMILHPEVQAKVHAEIDKVLGHDREPCLSDQGKLPYTESCILEVQRLACIVPLAIPHRAEEDVQVGDYVIPKGAYVFSVLHYIMRDPDYWPEANQFKPERFLDASGTGVRKEERFVPFGIGKRICLGESLAKAELFIMFIRLMQKFTFTSSEHHEPPTSEPIRGFISGPKPYYAVVKLRS